MYKEKRMLGFLFKKETNSAELLNDFYSKIKEMYSFDLIPEERKELLKSTMEKYGYLPYSQIKALEDHTEGTAVLFAFFLFRFRKNRLSVHGNRAVVWGFQKIQTAQKGGFTVSRRTDNRHHFALIHFKGDTLQNLCVSKIFRYVFYF